MRKEPEEADLVVTDPPYNVEYQSADGKTIENDAMGSEAFVEFLEKAFKNMEENLKEGGAFYIWHASRTVVEFEEALRRNHLQTREQLIWVKNSLVLGRSDYQWRHEPCLYGWKEGAGHYFINDRTLTTVTEQEIDLESMKKTEIPR